MTYHDISRREFCRTANVGVVVATEAQPLGIADMDMDHDIDEDSVEQRELHIRVPPAWILALRLKRGLTLEGTRLSRGPNPQ
jgi:hypothetical protein